MEVNLLLYDLKEAKKYWLKLSMANIKKQDANNETNQPKKNTETNQPKKKSKLLPIIVIFLLLLSDCSLLFYGRFGIHPRRMIAE